MSAARTLSPVMTLVYEGAWFLCHSTNGSHSRSPCGSKFTSLAPLLEASNALRVRKTLFITCLYLICALEKFYSHISA